ncbi:hypothetical protein [Sinomonas halotolerans]|uniref:Integral membrane protein n=1 Tax=Sinomonas halotolerans TaxID=1644133 RepID=A0ABU9X1K5_9MICC
MTDPSQTPAAEHRNEAVLGPFTLRDVTLLGGVLITFIGSLLPLIQRNALLNLWNAQNLFFLAVGFLVPAAAAALFVWRRLEPRRSLRVGSLSVDQFASVSAVLCCSYYFVFTVTTLTPGAVVGLLGAAALVAATTAARLIPPFAGDFDGRAATPAHIVARDAVAPVHRHTGQMAAVPAGTAAAPWAGHGADPMAAGSGAFPVEPVGAGPVGAAPVGAAPARGEHPSEEAASAETAAAPALGDELSTARPVGPGPAGEEPLGAERLGAEPAGGTQAPSESTADEPEGPAPVDAGPLDAAPEESSFGLADGEAYGSPAPEAPATAAFPVAGAGPGEGVAGGADEPHQQFEAFWFAVNHPRTAVDPMTGDPLFVLEPGQWILALQDRGHEFVVQNTDGRIGVLRELSGIERG